MVRDIMLDMKERDLLFTDKSVSSMPIFDSIWGNLFDEDSKENVLICNIIIPEAYWGMIKYENDEMFCRFHTPYVPDTNTFRIRLVALKEGKYCLFSNIRGDFGLIAYSQALNRNIATPISACILPYIDIDGEYIVNLVKNSHSENFDRAYVYSAKLTDLKIDYSDYQASQLLSLCAPGKYYRYPTTGVGITKYLNAVIEHTDLQEVLAVQFDKDNKPIKSADFDNETGVLDIICTPENGVSDPNLEPVENLNSNFFSLFTDEYVRRNVLIDRLSDSDFVTLLNNHDNVQNILLFIDKNSDITRISTEVNSGRFDGEGHIVSDDEHFIVSTTLDAGTIVMFDDESEDDYSDSPIFIINGHDETRLYTSLVEQPYWITDNCHKCFILNTRAAVQYVIEKTQFQAGKGLFVVAQDGYNIKNMLAVVQDPNTGRLLGVVSNSTNISDIVLDEITQRIYAIHLNQQSDEQ